MPQQNPTDIPNVQFFILGCNGQVFENKEKLPLEAVQEMEQFKTCPKLMRFAFSPQMNTIYVQDGREWKELLLNGHEEAWMFLNDILRYIQATFRNQPKLEYGEPPGTAEIRKLHQFEDAWLKLKEYIKKDMEAEIKDIPVVEYMPIEEDKTIITFNPSGGTKADVTTQEPTLFVNRKIDEFGQPNYEFLNKELLNQYLLHFKDLHTEEYGKNQNDYELYFAMHKDKETKVFKTSKEQANKLFDEKTLRTEPSLQNYDGPIILFYYFPKWNRMEFIGGDEATYRKYSTTNQMIDDIKRKLSKLKKIKESDIIVSYDDVSATPYHTTLSKHACLWDFVSDVLLDEGRTPRDINMVEMPLDEDKLAKLVNSPSEAGTSQNNLPPDITYPCIFVESRNKNMGIKYREILKEYIKFNKEILQNTLLSYSFKDFTDKEIPAFTEELNKPENQEVVKEIIRDLLDVNCDPRTILDFFAPRSNLVQRAAYWEIIDDLASEYDIKKTMRRIKNLKASVKQASLDIGINDWQKYGLQEKLNQAQHVNNKQTAPAGRSGLTPSFNLKEKRKVNPVLSTEGLLSKQHDKDLGFMKTTEQLLDESRI